MPVIRSITGVGHTHKALVYKPNHHGRDGVHGGATRDRLIEIFPDCTHLEA